MDERSAGAVVFNERKGRHYILLLNASRWDFPKGNMEKGESELQTVLREVAEETGLKGIDVVSGFRRVIEYFYRREGKNVHKRVVFLLASTPDDTVTISTEHQGFGWFTYEDAMKKATYDNSRATLKEAERFLQKKAKAGGFLAAT
ncbi:MAG: NUDIX domain-containing protein [Nitrososphaerales archaeon]|nr:NUDIX domain-containing protein [Nitrososphaerales archaeon]